jgi:hypothetical protein
VPGQARRPDAQPEQPGIRYPAQEGQPGQAGTRGYFAHTNQPTGAPTHHAAFSPGSAGAEMHNPIYNTMFQSDSAQVFGVAVQLVDGSVPGSHYQTAAGEYGIAHTYGSDRAGLQMFQTRPAQMPPLPRHPTAAQAATSGSRTATGARGSTGLRPPPGPPPTTKMSALSICVAGC